MKQKLQNIILKELWVVLKDAKLAIALGLANRFQYLEHDIRSAVFFAAHDFLRSDLPEIYLHRFVPPFPSLVLAK